MRSRERAGHARRLTVIVWRSAFAAETISVSCGNTGQVKGPLLEISFL